MREPMNIEQVAQLGVDMMGFIFYPKSPRYVSQAVDRSDSDRKVCRVGVFVNDSIPDMVDRIHSFSLNAVQLHGGESWEVCEQLREANGEIKIIKAISVSDDGSFVGGALGGAALGGGTGAAMRSYFGPKMLPSNLKVGIQTNAVNPVS